MGVLEELEKEREAVQRNREQTEQSIESLQETLRSDREHESRITKAIKVYKGEPLSKPTPVKKAEPAYLKYTPTPEVLEDVRNAAIRMTKTGRDKFTIKELQEESGRSDPATRSAVHHLRNADDPFLRGAGARQDNGNGRPVDQFAVFPEKMPEQEVS